MTAAAHRFLGRRDLVYLLGLLVPFLLYDLVLKAVRMASLPDEPGVFGAARLMRSDLLFDAGYALLWVGLFAVARCGPLRWVVVGLFHLATVTVALVATASHQFYEVTGSTLDFGTILFFLSTPGEVWAIAASELTPAVLIAACLILLYASLGPWLLASLVCRWFGGGRRTPRGQQPWASPFGFAGTLLAAFVLVSLSVLPGGGPAGASESFSREAFVNAAVTGLAGVKSGPAIPSIDAEAVREGLPLGTSLQPTARTERRNVVLVHLESVRAFSVTPYNPDLETTPFLDELAGESLVAERAYTVVPHTTNALVATACGVQPPLNRQQTYSVGDRIPARCMPELLGEQGYDFAYFTSSVQTFERRPDVVENMGYDEFYPVETMDKEGFEKANYFGYEDDVMLEPSREWLEENGDDGPFLATYETITPHHDYLAPDRYGRKEFAENDTLNRYQNSVNYVDHFLRNLIEQYKELGLYDDTIFVFYGDHGEGFGEHGRFQHDNTIYEEGLRIPLLVLDPGRFEGGERIAAPVNQMDVLPTVLDLLGYEVRGGAYPGSSLLEPLPEDRTLMASCWYDEKCLASIRGDQKYIYHFGNQPEEFYDLAEDPLEKNNLGAEFSPEDLKERREQLLEWLARGTVAYYGYPTPQG